jgi:gluconolactonase
MNALRTRSQGKDVYKAIVVILPLCVAGSVVGQTVPVLDGEIEKVFTTTSVPGWLEGPAYDGVGGVWFSDLGMPFAPPATPSTVLRFDVVSANTQTMIEGSGGANGLAFDADGRLIAAHGYDLNVTRRPTDDLGNVTVLASDWQGQPLNAPNDLALDAKGGIYFTDPTIAPEENAVFYISPAMELVRVPTEVVFNNGIALDPDGDTLYVASSGFGNIIAFDVSDDGSLTNQRVFVAPPPSDGRNFTPDGMTIDHFGNLYSSDLAFVGGPETMESGLPGSKVRVWNSAGEEILTFEPPEGVINLTFAGQDMLYFTSEASLWRVPIAFVPEPSGLILLSFAIGSLWFRRIGRSRA